MKQLFLLAMALVWGIVAQAQVDPVGKDGVAIGGYDVVSYFSGAAKQGNKTYAAKHDGANLLLCQQGQQGQIYPIAQHVPAPV